MQTNSYIQKHPDSALKTLCKLDEIDAQPSTQLHQKRVSTFLSNSSMHLLQIDKDSQQGTQELLLGCSFISFEIGARLNVASSTCTTSPVITGPRYITTIDLHQPPST